MENAGREWARGNAIGQRAARRAIRKVQEETDTLVSLVREIQRQAAKWDDAEACGFMFTIAAHAIGSDIPELPRRR